MPLTGHSGTPCAKCRPALPVVRQREGPAGIHQFNGQLQVRGVHSMRRQEARRFYPYTGVSSPFSSTRSISLVISRGQRPRTFCIESSQHDQHTPSSRSGFWISRNCTDLSYARTNGMRQKDVTKVRWKLKVGFERVADVVTS